MKYHNGYPVLRSPILRKHKLSRRTVIVNQLFGENLVSFYKKMGLLGHDAWDIRTKGTSQYLWHRLKGFLRLDRISKDEEKGIIDIQATHEGTVTFAGEDADGGRYVTIMSDELTIEGRKAKIETLYYHLDSWRKETGDEVRAGVIIGKAGNSGKYTTGHHLHFAIRVYWKVGKKYVADMNNGYRGRVDPTPFMADGTVWQRGVMGWRRFFQYGKQVSYSQITQ